MEESEKKTLIQQLKRAMASATSDSPFWFYFVLEDKDGQPALFLNKRAAAVMTQGKDARKTAKKKQIAAGRVALRDNALVFFNDKSLSSKRVEKVLKKELTKDTALKSVVGMLRKIRVLAAEDLEQERDDRRPDSDAKWDRYVERASGALEDLEAAIADMRLDLERLVDPTAAATIEGALRSVGEKLAGLRSQLEATLPMKETDLKGGLAELKRIALAALGLAKELSDTNADAMEDIPEAADALQDAISHEKERLAALEEKGELPALLRQVISVALAGDLTEGMRLVGELHRLIDEAISLEERGSLSAADQADKLLGLWDAAQKDSLAELERFKALVLSHPQVLNDPRYPLARASLKDLDARLPRDGNGTLQVALQALKGAADDDAADEARAGARTAAKALQQVFSSSTLLTGLDSSLFGKVRVYQSLADSLGYTEKYLS